jgi:hypothetical protein
VIEDVGLFDVIECAVPRNHIVDRSIFETAQLEHDFAPLTGDVFKMDVADIGAVEIAVLKLETAVV